jgi:lactate dehydrogenase-like 2-hydroxyacid dehydrogenase
VNSKKQSLFPNIMKEVEVAPMMKPKVYVTRPIPSEALVLLKERCDVEMNTEKRVLTNAELLVKCKERDAILVVETPINEELCQAVQSTCKIFANYGVGYNHIDIAAATKQGIFVSNTPDVVTDVTADLTWALLLATARRVIECDQFVRSSRVGWGVTNLIGTQVSGKTLGIFGGGRIGMAVAQRAKGFNMKIIYTDLTRNSTFEETTQGKFVDKETLLKEADFISIHVPLLPATHHLISGNEFRLMKNTAILINAARGPIVDEQALVEALQQGSIKGAGLDVFEREPEIEPGLSELRNVVLTPHVGTSTMEVRIAMGEFCAHNIFAVLDGQLPPACLNPEAQSKQKQ